MTIALNRPPADLRLGTAALPYTRATRELRLALHQRRRARRRWVHAAGVIAFVALAGAVALSMRPPASADAGAAPSARLDAHGASIRMVVGSERTHLVRPGESLWAIARAEYPGRDPRLVVAELSRRNDLHGSLNVGQMLRLP